MKVMFTSQAHLRMRGKLRPLMMVVIPTEVGDVPVWLERVWSTEPTKKCPLSVIMFTGYEIVIGNQKPVITDGRPSDHHRLEGAIKHDGTGYIEAGWSFIPPDTKPKVMVSSWVMRTTTGP